MRRSCNVASVAIKNVSDYFSNSQKTFEFDGYTVREKDKKLFQMGKTPSNLRGKLNLQINLGGKTKRIAIFIRSLYKGREL